MFAFPVILICFLVTGIDAWGRVEVFADRFEDDIIDVNKWNVADAKTATLTSGGPVNAQQVLIQNDATQVWEKEHKMFLLTNPPVMFNATPPHLFLTARVDTRSKFSYQYGEVEWSVQMPLGRGVSASLSLIPDDCKNDPCDHQIDLLYRGDFPNRVTFMVRSSYQYSSTSDTQHDGIDITLSNSLATNFNKFRILWDDQQVKLYVNFQDNQPENFAIIDNPSLLPHVPMHIRMDTSVGGWYAGLPNTQSSREASFLIIEEVTVHRWQ
ncbi:uncharacterized protein LOC129587401 [Paramacrobiotus metropolitanus]|uniref:uncharacterized protein LOC129587401 n=1 Tax=Paramacrobiotus metropolitanus TaxID=2943436 RepID=UPI00244641CB|nr:uncharacterized protein LOC129587401 [Paramacrobiotus metropolitanus]